MVHILAIVFMLGLGAAVGSFLNALSYRFRSGYSMSGRSRCFSCGKQLTWYELIPVLSFMLLRGRCSRCKTRISPQYISVEITTALLFLFSYLTFGLTLYAAVIALASSVLILILVYDLRHTIIPNEFVYSFAALALIAALIESGWGTEFSIFIDHVFAGIIYSSFFYLLWHASNGRWMGLGDAKLVGGIGFLLGLIEGITAVTLAFWIGAAVALAHIGVQRVWGQDESKESTDQLTMKSEIPFAPYLVVGTLLVLFLKLSIFII